MLIALGALADYASVTSDQKLVIAGVFDALVVGGLPAVHPSMALAVRLIGDPGQTGTHDIGVRLVDPDGHELVPPFASKLALASDDPSERGVSQFVLRLDNLTFKMAGRHSFDVLADGEYIGSVELRVRVQPSAAADAPGEAAKPDA